MNDVVFILNVISDHIYLAFSFFQCLLNFKNAPGIVFITKLELKMISVSSGEAQKLSVVGNSPLPHHKFCFTKRRGLAFQLEPSVVEALRPEEAVFEHVLSFLSRVKLGMSFGADH